MYFSLQAYGTQLARKVQYRHVLAKSYFSRIPDMADQMKSKVEQLPLPRPKEREIVARIRPVDIQTQTTDKQLVEAWSDIPICLSMYESVKSLHCMSSLVPRLHPAFQRWKAGSGLGTRLLYVYIKRLWFLSYWPGNGYVHSTCTCIYMHDCCMAML